MAFSFFLTVVAVLTAEAGDSPANYVRSDVANVFSKLVQ
jgi:hypothetical protein